MGLKSLEVWNVVRNVFAMIYLFYQDLKCLCTVPNVLYLVYQLLYGTELIKTIWQEALPV